MSDLQQQSTWLWQADLAAAAPQTIFTFAARCMHIPTHGRRYILEQMAEVVAAAAAAPGATAEGVVAAAAAAAPALALRKFIAVRTAGSSTHGGVCIQTAAVHTFLRELRGMALFGAVAGALPPLRTLSSGSLDEVLPTNCYTSGGCGEGQGGEGCCAPVGPAEQQAAGSSPGSPCAMQDAQQQRQRDSSEDSLAATAAACSSPALAASAAEPAVREDLSRERAAMLVLMAPREVWREIGDEQLQGQVLALLDTAAHSGGMQRLGWGSS